MPTRSIEQVLSEVKTFEGLEQRHLDRIAGCGRNHGFTAGEMIAREGDAADSFYVIRHGRVALEMHAPAGGPLAVVRTGDMIELDVAGRRLHLDIPEAELQARLAAWTPAVGRPGGGYAQLYHDHVEGADAGADLDFLKGCRGHAVARESH